MLQTLPISQILINFSGIFITLSIKGKIHYPQQPKAIPYFANMKNAQKYLENGLTLKLEHCEDRLIPKE